MLVFRLARVLIFAIATAGTVLELSGAASAVTFDGFGTHVLRSTSLGVNTAIAGGLGLTCTTSDMTVVVPADRASATVTATTFDGCIGTGAFNGVPFHMPAAGLPWEITRLAAGTFTIDAIRFNLAFTTTGNPIATLEGGLEGSINNTTHTVTFANSGELTVTTPLGNGPAAVTGDFTDNLNSLAIT